MELLPTNQAINTLAVDTIVISLFQGDTTFDGTSQTVNEATSGLLQEHVTHHEFEGNLLETLTFHSPAGLKAKHVIIVGLGKSADFDSVVARKAAAASIVEAKKLRSRSVATVIHGETRKEADVQQLSQAVSEGLLLGNYEFNRYKTKDQAQRAKQTITQCLLVNNPNTTIESLEQGIKQAEAICAAVLNVRDIINEPPSKIKPVNLVEVATEIASLSDSISLTVLDKSQLEKEGYNALLAVASGSEEPPYLIHLTYKPQGARKKVALVGKGVTFDSGGLSIKPWSAMLSMKSDMSGGGAVLGIIQALAELEALGTPVPVEVHGIVVTTENMISGKAMRPDDIIETKSGKTIEILHTDAEGRLILSDGLTYASLLKPDYMIDFATLTGAAIRALGRSYAAFMGNDRALLDTIGQASQQTGELAWELPLPDEYKKQLESPVADLQNISTNDYSPGAIFGGLFLQEFVNDVPWAHIDIAGPSFADEVTNPVYTKGGTGYGILLGLETVRRLVD